MTRRVPAAGLPMTARHHCRTDAGQHHDDAFGFGAAKGLRHPLSAYARLTATTYTAAIAPVSHATAKRFVITR